MKRCKECYNFNGAGTLGKATKGMCEINKEPVHGMKIACTTDFKSADDYGDYNRPIIFKSSKNEDSLVLQNIGYLKDYIDLEVEDYEHSASIRLTREDLRLLANNILDYLDGKEIEYPSVEVKNNDF